MLAVGCSLLVEVSVHGGMLTMTGSWWEENVITPKINVFFQIENIKDMKNTLANIAYDYSN